MAKTILRPVLLSLLGGAALTAAPAAADEPAPPAPPASTTAPAAADTGAPASSAPAEAPAPSRPETPAWETAPSLRRAGFTVGVQIAGTLGNITGYPSDLEKRDRPEFRADTGVTPGGTATVWLGGALIDWLVFGAGLSAGRSQAGGVIVQGFAFLFHTEVFPLFWMGGIFQDLGISLDTGGGTFAGKLESKPEGEAGKYVAPVIDSGAASRVGLGVFYDGFRISKLSGGPFVAFDYTWSSTLQQPLLLLGFRGALYTKAPKPNGARAGGREAIRSPESQKK